MQRFTEPHELLWYYQAVAEALSRRHDIPLGKELRERTSDLREAMAPMFDFGTPAAAAGYRIIVHDNVHYQDRDEAYEIGGFSSLEAALTRAKEIVEWSLREAAEPGRSAEAIFSYYRTFGDDPQVVGPPGEQVDFSAWDYARARSADFVLPAAET